MTWIEPLAGLARWIQAVSAAVLVLVAAVAVVAVNFAARAGFAIHRNAIELMHLLGAKDRYIAGRFQFQAFALALRGGAVGFGLAAATIAGIGAVGGQFEAPLLPALRLGLGGWVALATASTR